MCGLVPPSTSGLSICQCKTALIPRWLAYEWVLFAMKIESNTINSIFSQNRIAIAHNAKSAFHRHSHLSTLNLTTHVNLILHIGPMWIIHLDASSESHHFLIAAIFYIFHILYNNRLHSSLMFCENCLLQYRAREIPVIISSLLIRNVLYIFLMYMVCRWPECRGKIIGIFGYSLTHTHNHIKWRRWQMKIEHLASFAFRIWL